MTRNQKIVLATLMVAHLLLLYLTLSRNLDFLFNDASHRIGPGSDFWALYNAGKHWRMGNDIYMQGPGFGFRYHPIFAMTILSYISWLGYQAAYWLWVVINEIFVVVSLLVARKMVSDNKHFLTCCALLVCFTPYYLEVYMGNVSFITAVLLLVAVYLLDRRIPLRAYIIYLVSILIKPLGLLFFPILALRKRFGTVLLTTFIVAGLGLPYFVMHQGDWLKFAQVNLEGFPTNPGFLVHGGNQGFYALTVVLSAFANGIPTRELSALAQLPDFNRLAIRLIPYLFIGVSAWASYRLRRSGNLYVMVFLWSATYLLGYKDVWEHSYSFLVLGLFMLYLSGMVDRRLLLAFSCALALPTLFVFYDIPIRSVGISDPGWFWDFKTSLLHHATKPALLLALYLVVISKAVRSRTALLPTGGDSS